MSLCVEDIQVHIQHFMILEMHMIIIIIILQE